MIWRLTLLLALGVSLVSAGTVNYVCDGNSTQTVNPDHYAAGTCAYLNSNIAALYNSTFTNASANILVEMGNTGLGESDAADNVITYNQYVSALTATASHDTIDTSALTALSTLDTAVYGSDDVIVTNALAGALGFTTTGGVNASLNSCTLGTNGCYDGVIILAFPSVLPQGQSYYYPQQGGQQGSSSYDIYSVVEHETDEILGTSSCITTQGSTLADWCDSALAAAHISSGPGTPAATDLFRYNAAGQLAANNAYIGLSSAPAGAYFSYNGGVTNGAAGAVYNTISNSEDYADFASNCSHVQDADGCLGKSLDITNDGNSEINILDAEGFNLATPEPGTWLLLAGGLAVLLLRRRSRTVTQL